jgi:hypothetical protein
LDSRCHFEREAGLARPANCGQRNEAIRGEKALDLDQLFPASDQRCQLNGEVLSVLVRRLGR